MNLDKLKEDLKIILNMSESESEIEVLMKNEKKRRELESSVSQTIKVNKKWFDQQQKELKIKKDET